jgi:hypothetical protein
MFKQCPALGGREGSRKASFVWWWKWTTSYFNFSIAKGWRKLYLAVYFGSSLNPVLDGGSNYSDKYQWQIPVTPVLSSSKFRNVLDSLTSNSNSRGITWASRTRRYLKPFTSCAGSHFWLTVLRSATHHAAPSPGSGGYRVTSRQLETSEKHPFQHIHTRTDSSVYVTCAIGWMMTSLWVESLGAQTFAYLYGFGPGLLLSW